MLYLASQSPRRRELLELIGQRYEIVHVDVPELRGAEETPQAYVTRVARDKACAGLAALPDASAAVVLGADTEVVLDGEVFGKPADADDAAAMLRRLSGRVHRVLSAVWCVTSARQEHRFSQTEVSFAALTTAQIDAYLGTGEWRGKAGAYAIQGRAAAFVPHLSGSYSGVMGLPLFETAELLRAFGE
jgi:septum formation protein